MLAQVVMHCMNIGTKTAWSLGRPVAALLTCTMLCPSHPPPNIPSHRIFSQGQPSCMQEAGT
jgi:hypothetical protein